MISVACLLWLQGLETEITRRVLRTQGQTEDQGEGRHAARVWNTVSR